MLIGQNVGFNSCWYTYIRHFGDVVKFRCHSVSPSQNPSRLTSDKHTNHYTNCIIFIAVVSMGNTQ